MPRALTFEVPERIAHDGSVVSALCENAVLEIIERLVDEGIEAVGVCLLWSTVNPRLEPRIGKLLDTHLPSGHIRLDSRAV